MKKQVRKLEREIRKLHHQRTSAYVTLVSRFARLRHNQLKTEIKSMLPIREFSDEEKLLLSKTSSVVNNGISIDLRCLDNDWLSDEIINTYFRLIQTDQVAVVSTFFLSKLRQCTNKDGSCAYQDAETYAKNINDKRAVLFPVNIKNNHWVVLCADVLQHKLYVFDSMSPTEGVDDAVDAVKGFMEYSSNTPYEVHDLGMDVAQQDNGSDCGVFCCFYAVLCTKAFSYTPSIDYFKTPLSFPEAHYLRRNIKLKIIQSV